MSTYRLGDLARGYYEGEFESHETAAEVLAHRYLLEYPERRGERAVMWIQKPNEFGFEQFLTCAFAELNWSAYPESSIRGWTRESRYADIAFGA